MSKEAEDNDVKEKEDNDMSEENEDIEVSIRVEDMNR